MGESYTKSKLVAEIAAEVSLTKASVGRVLDRLTAIAYREAATGFVVPGICKLKVIRKKAARRRNPVTGKVFLIGERSAVKIVPLKKAKSAITPNIGVLVQPLEETPTASAPEAAVAAPPPAPAQDKPAAPVTAPAANPLAGGEEGQIVFPCAECGSMLAASPKMAGQNGECPFCGAATKIPSTMDRTVVPEKQTVGGAEDGAPATDFILFVCRACGQEIEAPSDMVGMDVECPTCGTSLTVPIAGGGKGPGETQKIPAVVDEQQGNRKAMTIRIDLSDLE